MKITSGGYDFDFTFKGSGMDNVGFEKFTMKLTIG